MFLNTDPQARRYVREMDYKWKTNYNKWLFNCNAMRAVVSELEGRIRAVGAELDTYVENLAEIPNADAFNGSKHIFDKIRETDWYQSWSTLTDKLDPGLLHIEPLRQTQTGYMISHVLSITRALARLAEAIDVEKETTTELRAKAERLWREYGSAQWKVKNDWMSSAIHALEQLRTAVRIMDGDVFIDPANLEPPKIRLLTPWMVLMVRYAPPGDLKNTFKQLLKHPDTANKDFEKDLEPLIRSYLQQVFTGLLFLANTRLAHQHLVERYKARCENYDWKHIAEMAQSHAGRVGEEAEKKGKSQRYRFEDLLTLYFARYLHDNGYAVHYRSRDGVHEPDLLGNLSSDLEPVVVEAKVVGQTVGTEQSTPWIEEGLRALLAYLQKYHSDYGVTDGYLIVFRMGDETFPMYTFQPAEWIIGQFTIIPKVINIGRINKKDSPIVIRQESFLQNINDTVCES